VWAWLSLIGCSRVLNSSSILQNRDYHIYLYCFQIASQYTTCLMSLFSKILRVLPQDQATVCALSTQEDSRGFTLLVFSLKVFFFLLIDAYRHSGSDLTELSTLILSLLETSNCLWLEIDLLLDFQSYRHGPFPLMCTFQPSCNNTNMGS